MTKARDIRIARRRKCIGELLIPRDVVAIIVDYINDLVPWRESEDPQPTMVRYRISIGGELFRPGLHDRLQPEPVPRFGDRADHRYLQMVKTIASIGVYSLHKHKN